VDGVDVVTVQICSVVCGMEKKCEKMDRIISREGGTNTEYRQAC
jgi:hypothetical protein